VHLSEFKWGCAPGVNQICFYTSHTGYSSRVAETGINTATKLLCIGSPSSRKDATRASKSAEAFTREMGPMEARASVGVAYEFSGMHYIFDHHKTVITSIRFAHENRDLLAVASMDGTISICSTFEHPTVQTMLIGHQGGVTDIDWSLSNEFVLSSSLDGTVRVWDVKTGKLIRATSNPHPCHCCRFLPLNANIFVYGTTKGTVNVMNLSTGKLISQVSIGPSVICLEFEPTGKTLFVGDEKGFVSLLQFDILNSTLSISGKSKVVKDDKGVTSLEYKSWFNNQKGVRTPQLIAACQDSTIKLCAVEGNRAVRVQRAFFIKNRASLVRCSFCPLISTQVGACIVSGSEDTCIYIYNLKKKGEKALVNKLQGHSGQVLAVSWNYEESLLASGDSVGVVIIWKRVHLDSTALMRQ